MEVIEQTCGRSLCILLSVLCNRTVKENPLHFEYCRGFFVVAATVTNWLIVQLILIVLSFDISTSLVIYLSLRKVSINKQAKSIGGI